MHQDICVLCVRGSHHSRNTHHHVAVLCSEAKIKHLLVLSKSFWGVQNRLFNSLARHEPQAAPWLCSRGHMYHSTDKFHWRVPWLSLSNACHESAWHAMFLGIHRCGSGSQSGSVIIKLWSSAHEQSMMSWQYMGWLILCVQLMSFSPCACKTDFRFWVSSPPSSNQPKEKKTEDHRPLPLSWHLFEVDGP